MTEWDKKYLELCRKVLESGVEVESRTGINTIIYPEPYDFRFDMQEEFPILTTKELFTRQAVLEMLWIWQVQSNKVKWLQDRNVNIWDLWEVDSDGIYRTYEPYGEFVDKEVVVIDPKSVPVNDPDGLRQEKKPKLDRNGNIMKAKSLIKKGEEAKTIKSATYFGKQYAGTIGTAYGFITDRYKLTQNLIDTIKTDPTNRRMVTSLWQNEFLRTAVLPSCVWSSEWRVVGDKLNLSVHQRSCDIPLGLPFNITQYAVFLSMVAQVTDLKPGVIKYSISDPHIYVNQIDGIKEQIRREDRYNELSKFTKEDLLKLQETLQEKISKIENKKSKEYSYLDTELRTIDMILNPSKPKLWLNEDVKDFFSFDNSKDCKDVKVLNYKNMGKIRFPLAQ